MKLSLFTSINPKQRSAYQKLLSHFFSTALRNPHCESQGIDSLYRRISPIGDPHASVVPILDQWVKEGRPVSKQTLQIIIKELRKYKRYKHALEVSQWMTDKRYFYMLPQDAAWRLTLIFKVHGLEQAERYFDSIPQQIKDNSVYAALLNCYAHERSVEKAEALMQNLDDLGCVKAPVFYSIMMNLYYQLGQWKMLDNLMNEMKHKGMYYDILTLSTRLSAYAAASDAKGVDKIVTMMESDPNITMNFDAYSVAAHAYLKVGLVDKTVEVLKKMEGQMTFMKRKSNALTLLLYFYSETGHKDEFHRIWDLYKQGKILNKGYISMMRGLMKFDDIEGMEKIFKEWESLGFAYDFRVPNCLLHAYCRHGHLGKAEELLNRGISSGGTPSVNTWYYLAGGYVMGNEVGKALCALRKAISICPPDFTPSRDTLSTCLHYLEMKHSEKAEEFMSFLKETDLFSAIVRDKLFLLLRAETPITM